MATNTASTDTATTTDTYKIRVPLAKSGFNPKLHLCWSDGYAFVENGDEPVSDQFEVSVEEFRQMAHMVEEFIQCAYKRGENDKAAKIREALGIKFGKEYGETN